MSSVQVAVWMGTKSQKKKKRGKRRKKKLMLGCEEVLSETSIQSKNNVSSTAVESDLSKKRDDVLSWDPLTR